MKRKTALFSPSKLFNTTEHELPSAFSFTHFYTHSTAVEVSTVTEVENRLMFDDGISPDKPLVEQLMNLDLKNAYTLKESNVLERVGAKKNGHWAVKV